MAASTDWHTPPDKWKEPRIYHTPFGKNYSKRIKTGRDIISVQLTEKVWSPNKAYWFMVTRPNFKHEGPRNTTISISNERNYLVQISLLDHYSNFEPTVKWINQKLLYIEVWWGRILGSAIIFDVEKEKIVHKEMIHWGAIAFQQWQQGIKKTK